jgi:hypothetical protein
VVRGTGRLRLHEGGVVEADHAGGCGLAKHRIHEGVQVGIIELLGLCVQVGAGR